MSSLSYCLTHLSIYIRRCLERGTRTQHTDSGALARHERNKEENAGVPYDSGRTVKELEGALKRQQKQIKEYEVPRTAIYTKNFEGRNKGKIRNFTTILGRYVYGSSNQTMCSCYSVLEQNSRNGFISNLKVTFKNFAIGINKLPYLYKQQNLKNHFENKFAMP